MRDEGVPCQCRSFFISIEEVDDVPCDCRVDAFHNGCGLGPTKVKGRQAALALYARSYVEGGENQGLQGCVSCVQVAGGRDAHEGAVVDVAAYLSL